MANLGNTIINGILRVNGKINSSDVISAPSFVGALTGNADTATKLKTARTINGTSFDGSGNITTANWGTARNIGIVNSDGTGTAVTVSVNGSGNINLKLPATIKAALTGNAATATNATNIGITNTNPTSGTWYYPTWVTGTSGNLPERTNDGLRYYSLQGTTSALGHSYVQIGNATAAGTAGNKQGHLRIYSGSSGYVDLDVSTTTSNFTITLPAASGTVSLNGHTHSYLPLSGGNLTGRTTVQSAGQKTPAYTNTQLLIDTTLNTPNPSLGFREQGTSDGVLYMHQRALYWSSAQAIAGEVPAANTGYKILHTGNFTNTIGDVLLKSGGTMNETAQIQRKGGTPSSWYNGRDNALIKYNSYTGYNPLLSMKTTAGSWELGAFSDNKLHLSYITDANYTAKTNAQTRDFVFNVASNTITASIDGNAATASKAAQLTTARNINGVSFNGTANININKLVCIDVSGQTIDWNTYCYTNGYTEGIWNSASDGGASSFTNLAVSGKSCRIELKLIRFVSTSDYIQLQEQLVGGAKTLYRRYCVNGTWTNWVMVSVDGVAANATKLATARTIGVSGVTGTAQSFNGTANIVIPITAVPSTLLTNKSAIKGSEITNDKHWVPSSDASVTNFVSMTAKEYATNASGLATGTIVAITDGVEGYVTTQATSLTCDLPLDL